MATRSHKLAGTAGHVIGYLKDDEVAQDYYSNDTDELTFSRTWGRLATDLGIGQGLTREQFGRLFHGQDPRTGEQLASGGHRITHDDTGEVVAEAVRTPMIDVVYSTPKSVSEYLVTASPEMRTAVADKAMAAAKAAFEAMESSAKLARVPIKTPVGARNTKQQGSATERQLASLIAVPVVQFCARPTEETVERGAPPDPSLHVHVPVFTLCKADNGRYYTADEYGLKNRRNVELRDSVFMGELARGLEELGIELEYNTVRQGRIVWEVKGSNPELRRFWSSNGKRAWAIRQEFEEKHGRPITDAELTRALYVTRKAKTKADKAQDSKPVWERWAQDARAHGYKLRALEYHQPIEHDAWESLGILSKRLESANGLCRENAVFSAADIRPAVARCAVGLGFTPEELDGYTATLTAPDNPYGLVPVRRANDPEHSYWTTPAVIAAELRIAQAASEKDRVVTEPIDELTIARTLREADVKLDAEQIEAVREMCAGKGWVNFIGPAGSGKSTVLKAVVGAHRAHDKFLADKAEYQERVAVAAHRQGRPARNDGRPTTVEIVVASMTGKAANDTGQKIGADRWGSVESICRQVESGKFKPTKNTLVSIEECGQLDTMRADKLRKAIGPARVIPLGDPAQLTPIGAGGWWDDNLSKHGSVELTVVRRHKDPKDVADFDLIRRGRAPEALRNMDERGRVHVSEDRSHRVADVLMDYTEHRKGWRAQDVRIIADTSNDDIDTMNRFCQRSRLEHGEVGAAGFEIHDESQGRRWTLRENDQVLFLRAHFIKGQTPVKNGTEGVIVSLDARSGTARVRIPDGDAQRIVRMRLNAHEESQALGLAYAVHANKYQGAEVPVALVMPGMGQTNANSAYSMVTRSTHETHVYLAQDLHSQNPIEVLGKAWSERELKQSALSKLNEIRRAEYTRQAQEREAEHVELLEVPELEPVPALEDADLDRLEHELQGPSFERPSFDRPSLDRDVSMDLGRGIDRGV